MTHRKTETIDEPDGLDAWDEVPLRWEGAHDLIDHVLVLKRDVSNTIHHQSAIIPPITERLNGVGETMKRESCGESHFNETAAPSKGDHFQRITQTSDEPCDM